MESGSPKMRLLCADNWHSWRVDIKVLLMDRACWGFIDGTEPEFKPETASRKEIVDFTTRKNRAFSTIYYSVDEQYRSLLSDTTSGKDAYAILENYFQPSTRARVISLLDEFFSLRFDSGTETIGLFCARLKQCVQRLADAGHPLEDLYQGFQLIRFLPQEFNGIVQLIYRWENIDFTFEKISKELLLEENRLNQLNRDLERVDINSRGAYSTSIRNSANFPKSRKPQFSQRNQQKLKQQPSQNKPKSNSQTHKNDSCFRCGQKGHWLSQCKQKAPNTMPGNLRKTNSQSNFMGAHNVEILNNQVQEDIDKFSWCLDTGATHHFTNNRNLFYEYTELADTSMAMAVGGVESPVEGKGSVRFHCNLNGGRHDVAINNVMYSPKLRRNLMSMSKLEQYGARFVGSKGYMTVYNAENVQIFKAKRVNDLYIFRPQYEHPKTNNIKVVKRRKKSKNVSTASKLSESDCDSSASVVNVKSKRSKVNASSRKGDIHLWHSRYSHTNQDYIIKTSNNDSVKGLPALGKMDRDCVPCKLAKTKRKSFKAIGKIRSKAPLQLLHMDLCGKMPVTSHGGSSYFLTITDDYSRKVVVFPLERKSDVFQTFTRFQNRAERFLNQKVVCGRTDNGLEFCHAAFEEFLSDQGIKMERSNTYTPEQNGVSERFNLTALDGIKAMLNDSGLDDKFWAEALLSFTYTWNRVCHKDQTKTPFELYGGRKPSVSHLRVFGCLAYAGIPKQKRQKLEMRAKMGVMVGYAMRTRGYRIWFPDRKRLDETSNVSFNESERGVDSILGPNDPEVALPSGFQGPKFAQFEPADYQEDSEGEGSIPERPREVETPSPTTSSELLTPCLDIPWTRSMVPRPDGSKIDIYYGIEGKTTRIRSPNEAETYCKANKIMFERNIFDFSVKNKFKGKVSDMVQNQGQS